MNQLDERRSLFLGADTVDRRYFVSVNPFHARNVRELDIRKILRAFPGHVLQRCIKFIKEAKKRQPTDQRKNAERLSSYGYTSCLKQVSFHNSTTCLA